MAKIDLRPIKRELRDASKAFRRALPPEVKQEKDRQIFERLCSLQCYQQARTLLCFVSLPIEVDTYRIIRHAFEQGKQVAVPKCLKKNQMKFYLIHSFDDLEAGTFSVLEPKLDQCEELTDETNSLCIVPGLCFDLNGYRLGYGGGYYDRFLDRYPGITLGICYNACIKGALPHGRYDRTVDGVVTEKFVKRIGSFTRP
ncbi:MAG TPA: 5-formyltetrahydrofolate cyclo-ligase [Firmicutes bacterium]|nr:5-formyltetrahydrofolate cyclo-ligase [Bacillota bacterium]